MVFFLSTVSVCAFGYFLVLILNKRNKCSRTAAGASESYLLLGCLHVCPFSSLPKLTDISRGWPSYAAGSSLCTPTLISDREAHIFSF